jgi:hypothetical protein
MAINPCQESLVTGKPCAGIIDAQKEYQQLRAAFIRYGEHERDCACWDKGDHGDRFPRHDWECTCGFGKVLGNPTDPNKGLMSLFTKRKTYE